MRLLLASWLDICFRYKAKYVLKPNPDTFCTRNWYNILYRLLEMRNLDVHFWAILGYNWVSYSNVRMCLHLFVWSTKYVRRECILSTDV